MTVYKDNEEALEGLGYDSEELMDELVDRVSSHSFTYEYHNQFYRMGFSEWSCSEIIDECIREGIDLKKYKQEN